MVIGIRYGQRGSSGYSGYSGVGVSGPFDAEDVLYTNPGEPSIDNVKEALDLLFYVAPQITSFTNSVGIGGVVEIGSTVTDVTLNWAYNKIMVSASLTDVGAISPSLLTYAFSGLSLTSNKTYTLTAGDGTNIVSRSTTIYFNHKRYWGVNALTTLDDAAIIALANKEFASSRVKSVFSMNGEGKYIYYCYPAAWGEAEFWVNGLLNTAWTKSVQTFINASGYSASFNVYRTNTVQFGTGIQIEVR